MIVPLTFTLAGIGFAIFMYGIHTITAPFNYEANNKYLEKQGFKIDTPYVFLYKNVLINGAKREHMFIKKMVMLDGLSMILFLTMKKK